VEIAASEHNTAHSPGTTPPATPRDGIEEEKDGNSASNGAVARLMRKARKLPGVSYLMRAVGGGSATDAN
jgi:hypothetical protein